MASLGQRRRALEGRGKAKAEGVEVGPLGRGVDGETLLGERRLLGGALTELMVEDSLRRAVSEVRSLRRKAAAHSPLTARLGFRVSGFGIRGSGFGFRVSGLGQGLGLSSLLAPSLLILRKREEILHPCFEDENTFSVVRTHSQ